MSTVFHITPGSYVIPHIGRIDTSRNLTDDKAFAIYRLPRRVFPWITPKPEAEEFLKKQRLRAHEVAALIENARTFEEAEMLSRVSKTKTVARAFEAWCEENNTTVS